MAQGQWFLRPACMPLTHTHTHSLVTHRLGLDTWELNLVNSPGAVHSEPVWGATEGQGFTLSLGAPAPPSPHA